MNTRNMGLVSFLVGLATAVGCTSSLGVKTVGRDQFGYAEALRDAWKEQMLLNLVGLRYAEAPMFLKVASVINSYSFEGALAAASPGYDEQTVVSPPLQISGRYADRPTVTYLPLSGAEFTRSVLTPIPPHAIMSLAQAGWRVDHLFRLTVRAVNGVSQESGSGASGDGMRFYELMSLLTEVQQSGGLSFRVEDRGVGKVAIVRIDADEEGPQRPRLERISELLDLDPQVREYHLVFGAKPAARHEIAMLSRSILEMLAGLSMWIDVPPAHLGSGRVLPPPSTEAMERYGFRPMITVRSSAERPADAFVAVRHDGTWFWIDHDDFDSKRTLGFMQLMFSLAESSGGQREPLVTVQAGG